MLSVCLFVCNEVWTLGVWGELKDFLRLGTWCAAFVCVCVCVCVWWLGGGFVCGGLAGKKGDSFSYT